MRIRSKVWKGYRWRTIFNQLIDRPLSETFREFLIRHVLPITVGRPWWEANIAKPPAQKHAIAEWHYALGAQMEANTNPVGPDGLRRLIPTGQAWEYFQLGHDLLCLQEMNRLPEHLVERLRSKTKFQGARYEIAVASVLTRAGFTDFEYLDDKDINEKHCEFFAVEPHTKTRIAVEAKSRVRAGVLHEPGTFNYTEDFKGVQNLFRRAREQRPQGVPYMIFMDMNLPRTPGVDLMDKQWFKDLKRTFDCEPLATADKPDRFTALFVTNLVNHYATKDRALASEVGFVMPMKPEAAVPYSVVDRIMTVLEDYTMIPHDA